MLPRIWSLWHGKCWLRWTAQVYENVEIFPEQVKRYQMFRKGYEMSVVWWSKSKTDLRGSSGSWRWFSIDLRYFRKLKVSKSTGQTDVVTNVRGKGEEDEEKMSSKTKSLSAWTKTSNPKLNWKKKRCLIVWSFARSLIWLCVFCVTFFRCTGVFVHVIDWLIWSSCVRVCASDVDSFFYVMCVRVRSCHVSGCAQDYSVWYESRYDVSARDETNSDQDQVILLRPISLTESVVVFGRNVDVYRQSSVTWSIVFLTRTWSWSSDAGIASVKTAYAVSSWDQWKFCMCHKRLYECHATNIHQCFPWRRHSQADLGVPSSPSFDTKSFHDHGCAREQDHLGRIDTGFHERFLSYSPSQLQVTIFRAQTFILWQKTTISCESPPEFPLKVQMTKYILPLLMFL